MGRRSRQIRVDPRNFMPIGESGNGAVKRPKFKRKCERCGKFKVITPNNKIYCDECSPKWQKKQEKPDKGNRFIEIK